MVSECAPVALFAFRRPDHLSACLESLARCHEAAASPLYVFCDGPKGTDDERLVDEVRNLARAARGFLDVTVVERETNLGLAASVIAGVAAVLEMHDRVVVVEDDLVVSPDFLQYMNEALAMYAEEEDVVSIHGYMYSVREELPQSFFLRGADCWGWGTWRRGWQIFDPDGSALLVRLRDSGEERAFDLDGSYPYMKMLEDQVSGRIDSWAVRWYASAFLAGKVTLYPGTSLVENIGQDGSGTHSSASASHDAGAGRMTLPLERIPVAESRIARAAVVRTLAGSHGSWASRTRARVQRWRRA